MAFENRTAASRLNDLSSPASACARTVGLGFTALSLPHREAKKTGSEEGRCHGSGKERMSSQRVQGTVVEVLTVRLFPVQRGADVRRERREHDSPPTPSPGAIGPFVVDRAKNGVDRSIDVR